MKKQQGAVLLMAMIFLIVITIIGVSAVNSSSIQTQTAGNNISSMLVYNGAESALAKSANHVDQKNLTAALATPNVEKAVPAVYLPDESTGNGTLKSTAGVTFLGVGLPCPIGGAGMAISSVMTCKVWVLNAESKLQGTNAKDRHLQGIAIIE